MKYYHKLDDMALTLINFKKIFALAQIKFLNSCKEYGYNKQTINYKNSDVKRLLQHHVIYETCEEILNHKSKNKKVIIYRNLENSDTFEIQEYSKLVELNNSLLRIVVAVKRYLPIQIVIFTKEISFDKLQEKLEAKDGETIELVYKILCQLQPLNNSFQKVKKFAKKNKLTFLSEKYFDLLRTKQLFL